MKNLLCVLLNVLYSFLEISRSQYVMVNQEANKLYQCDRNNALVEQFFNIIFTEFHRTPPVCVCVQMCIDSPTYCYPNGCLRNLDRRKRANTTTSAHPVNRIQYDGHNPSKSVMFLVDSDKDLIDNIFNEPRINSYSERKEKPTSTELMFSPNPFRELVFKYRKVPKLEMRYNLREKLKNTRSDKIKADKLDVSRTKWSMKRQLLSGKQLLNRIGHYKKNDVRRTFFASMFPEIESLSMKQKSLAKRDDASGFNVDAFYIYKTNVGNFSVENLINDLIISSLDDNKDGLKINKRMQFDDTVVTTTEPSTYIVDGNDIETTVTNNVYEITTVDRISMDSTHGDNYINNDIPNLNLLTNNKTYLEEIAKMSEEIEKNNNVTIEFVKRLSGLNNLKYDTINNNSIDILKSDSNPIVSNESYISKLTTVSDKNNEIIIDVNRRWTAPVLKANFNQKSRQRITRKLKQKFS